MHNIKQLRIVSRKNKASRRQNSRRFSHDFGKTRKKPNARHHAATGVFRQPIKNQTITEFMRIKRYISKSYKSYIERVGVDGEQRQTRHTVRPFRG